VSYIFKLVAAVEVGEEEEEEVGLLHLCKLCSSYTTNAHKRTCVVTRGWGWGWTATATIVVVGLSLSWLISSIFSS